MAQDIAISLLSGLAVYTGLLAQSPYISHDDRNGAAVMVSIAVAAIVALALG